MHWVYMYIWQKKKVILTVWKKVHILIVQVELFLYIQFWFKIIQNDFKSAKIYEIIIACIPDLKLHVQFEFVVQIWIFVTDTCSFLFYFFMAKFNFHGYIQLSRFYL